ncbi:protein kinase [Nocardia sp. NPDC056064]|uniref:serine/threonine-protein kinase n=1 Tax=Nocardia sp. NPDC056064 TaxID=3345701 RepID=UPI0035E2DB2F
MALRPGDTFAGYIIEGILGVGGMGIVYLALHPRLSKRRVALKVLADVLAGNADARRAFDREAELVADLRHPNIVTIYDRSKPGEPELWLSMGLVPGGDVKALLADSPRGLAPELVLRLLSDAAEALDYAHSQGILHRDVKPANLLIEPAPRGGLRAVLGDFGIARALDATATASAIAVTFAYAAPERFLGSEVDHRADVYSLGCTLHELLTGQTPYPLDTQAAVMGAHLRADPPSPHALRPDLPAALDAVIAKALAKDPDDRYVSCAELVEATRRSLTDVADQPGSGGTSAPPAAPTATAPKPPATGTTRVPAETATKRWVPASWPDADNAHRSPTERAQSITTGSAGEHSASSPPTSGMRSAGAQNSGVRRSTLPAKSPIRHRLTEPMLPGLSDRQIKLGQRWEVGFVVLLVLPLVAMGIWANGRSGVDGATPSAYRTTQALDEQAAYTRTASPSMTPAERSSSDATTTTRRPTTSASATSAIDRSTAVTTTVPVGRSRPRALVGDCIALNATGNLTRAGSDCENGDRPYKVKAILHPDNPDWECPNSKDGFIVDEDYGLCLTVFMVANYCYRLTDPAGPVLPASCSPGNFVALRTTRSVSGCGGHASLSFHGGSTTYCIRYL